MRSKIVFLTCVAIFVLPISVQSAEWQDVNGQDMLNLLSNKTANGGSYTMYYGGNGDQKGRWGGFVHTGKYYTNDKGHFCNKWMNWDKGKKEGCWSVSHKGGKEVRFQPESGRAEKVITLPLKEGNVNNL